MDHVQKMFLVPQHQLDKLKNLSFTPAPIRQTVENELDQSIREILSRTDMDPHEKAKQYAVALQRFIAIVKQGDKESNILKLSLPTGGGEEFDTGDDQTHGPDALVQDVIKGVPPRSKKNATYVLEKIAKSGDVATWNAKGEFVFRGKAVSGSHMLDLIKNITASHKVSDDRRPLGWQKFIEALAIINMPLSVVPNQQVRNKISTHKKTPTVSPLKTMGTSAKVPGREFPSPAFSSPVLDRKAWLSF